MASYTAEGVLRCVATFEPTGGFQRRPSGNALALDDGSLVIAGNTPELNTTWVARYRP